MPAVGAAMGPVGVAEVVVEELKLELEELGVTTGVEEEEDEELLDEEELLLKELRLDELEELALAGLEVLTGVEELLNEELLVGLLDGMLEPLLVLVALEVELEDDDDDDELLLIGVTVLLADDEALGDALAVEVLDALLELEALKLVEETVEVTKPEDETEVETLEAVVELLTATAMTLAPQTPLLLGVPTPLFK
jgi:hypothetical protein